MTTENKSTSNYTEAMENRLREAAEENGGAIDNALAGVLATEFGTVGKRSVIAKATRMEIYKAKEKTSKSGGPVERKEDIATEIGNIVGANMEGLENAPKLALQRLRDFVVAASE